ncbi:class F sortase [Arthrobacter sp. ISL-30]|uniref:class F sortase n=1 Tax=Arthrobacter sp. ISL-30 TaxID=2819109 RepID=UPI001BEBD22A|nr:class F sortase [Arthrobacter sp. ISL-30]MBT2512643.1 class F sortase [Arthrobacter sp. ISL-30]
MSFPRRHPRVGVGTKFRGLNRVDLLLLAFGVVAFLVLTFAPGIFSSGEAPGKAGTQPTGTSYSSTPPHAMPAATIPGDGQAAPEAESVTGSPTTAQVTQEPAPNFPPAAAPTRIVYPAAGFDVAVHALNPSAEELETQAIVPPITMDGYWVSAFGMPGAGSTNTTYIIGHSWEGRDAPFNRLSSSSSPGDIFEATTAAGTMRYRVDSVDTYQKATLKDSPIWEATPNRIVLVSCYTEDPWGKNVVVVASPVAS